MDESRRLAMRRAHTRNKEYCSCGKIVRGNGGISSHRAMHERKGEWRRDFTGAIVNSNGHHFMAYSDWLARHKHGGKANG